MTMASFPFKSVAKYLQDGTADLNTDTLKVALVSSSWHVIPDDARSTAYEVGDTVKDASNYYYCIVAGTTSGSAPTFPTNGSAVTDGTAVWQDVGTSLVGGIPTIATWPASTAVVVGQMVRPVGSTNGVGHWYQCTVAGTTGASEPTYVYNGGTFSDNTVTWQDMGISWPVFVGDATVWANISTNEISGTGYTTGGETVTSPTITTAPQTTVFDAADVTWTTATITMRWAVLYRSGTVNSLTDPVLYAFLLDDTPADVSVSGNDFILRWNASGILETRYIPAG